MSIPQPSRQDLDAVWSSLLPHRGRANPLNRLVATTQIPMLLVDNEHRIVDANAATRLFLRRTRDELSEMRTYDLLAPGQRPALDGCSSELARSGSAAGTIALRAPDSVVVRVDYCAVANMLPGVHIFMWMPVGWAEDELVPLAGPRGAERPTGRLTAREREVLGVLAAGASIEDISAELSLSYSTVRTHLRNAMRRLGARHRAQAIAIAMRDGEIDVADRG
jgi:DNA-binding CsgD family transcriptional regulator